MISEIVFVNLSLIMETKYPICDVTVFFFFSQRSGIQKLFMHYVSVLKDKITIVHIVQVKKKTQKKAYFHIFMNQNASVYIEGIQRPDLWLVTGNISQCTSYSP